MHSGRKDNSALHKKILKNMYSDNKVVSANEISLKLGVHWSTIDRELYKMEVMGLVESFISKQGTFYRRKLKKKVK